MPGFDKIVLVTQKTALEELIERENTRAQAKFRLVRAQAAFAAQYQTENRKAGTKAAPAPVVADFGIYEAAHKAYHAALDHLKASLPEGVRSHVIERGFLPNFLFGEHDLVIALGRDGLVVNTAKYLNGQPLLGLNPDPKRIDGILVPFSVREAPGLLPRVLAGKLKTKRVTMAKASLNNGQALYAVNDLFIGQRTHLSARYHLEHKGKGEDQSSSGIIISTGAGSTGWFRSILTGASGVVSGFTGHKVKDDPRDRYRFPWDANYLCYSVREPFISKASAANLIFGRIEGRDELIISSQMGQGGVIFSDGIESDFLEFNGGSIAQISVAEKKVNLVVPG